MKITMTVDCTPEEARRFLGLPDISALQLQITEAMQEQLRQQMSTDPETAMKAWFGPAMMYWQQMFKPTEPSSS